MFWLQPSINLGLSEFDFWNMTVAEIERFSEGAVWRLKRQAQFDYSLADLIGISVSRTINSGTTFPTIMEVYPDLFEKERIEEEQKLREEEIRMTNSANRFMEFALKHNAKMRKEVEEDKL